MFFKWLCIFIAFVASLSMLFMALLFYYNGERVAEVSGQENKSYAVYSNKNSPARSENSVAAYENKARSQYADVTEEKDTAEDMAEESESVVEYMEKIEKSIATRRRSLLHKLDLLDQEDRAVRAVFERTLERLRIEKIERMDYPPTRRINTYERNSPEILLPYMH